MKRELILCQHCGKSSFTDEVIKSCGNCFACVGCEIYICPWCGTDIVIKPLPQDR